MAKILIIEDDEAVRENTFELLEAQGYEVIAASNGEEALSQAKFELPDLIICDVMMPGIDGYAVLRELRSHPTTQLTPFIFLTAIATNEGQRRGMNLGADDYITKPFKSSDLLHAIATRLAKHQETIKQTQERIDGLCKNLAMSFSHEIRTPLNGILGGVQLCLEDCQDDEMQENLLMIQSSAQRLTRLMANQELFIELDLSLASPLRQQKARELICTYPESVIEVEASQVSRVYGREEDLLLSCSQMVAVRMATPRIQKLVEVLIDNAFKFSPPNSPVTVTTEVEDEWLILSVTNMGRGMTALQIADIGPYRQFDREQQQQQGLGLGLAIAQRLCWLHGGSLEIDSVVGEKTRVRAKFAIAFAAALGAIAHNTRSTIPTADVEVVH